MTLRKKLAILSSLGIISILLGSLFYYNMVKAQDIRQYDPWCDLNDDGKINIRDIALIAIKFGTEGESINKTALLLELLDRVEALEAKFPITTDEMSDYAVTNDKLAPQAVPLSHTYARNWNSTTSGTFVEMPRMSVDINLTRSSRLLVVFSGEFRMDQYQEIIIACHVPDITYERTAYSKDYMPDVWKHFSGTFISNQPKHPGIYNVKIFWKVSAGTAYVADRSLTVIALPE